MAKSEALMLRRELREGGAVVWLTIDNRHKLNTLGSTLLGELLGVLESLSAETELRAVVLTGAGERAFIGGASVAEMARLDPESARTFILRLHRCCAALRALPVPVIARIRGYALGAGLEVAASCDIRLAADDAVFGMPEVKLGIPSVIEAALLPRLIGAGRASSILLTGETFGAAEAGAWGLVEHVGPPAALDAAVEARLAALLSAAPAAVRAQKRLIRAWENLPLDQAVAVGIDAFAAAFAADEPRTRMAEFLNRPRTRPLSPLSE